MEKKFFCLLFTDGFPTGHRVAILFIGSIATQCCQHRSAMIYLFFNVLICFTPCTVITLITLVHLFVKIKLCIKTVLKSITPSEVTALIHTTLSYIWKLNFCKLQQKMD